MLSIVVTSIVAYQWIAGTAPFKLSGKSSTPPILNLSTHFFYSMYYVPLGSVPEGVPNFTVPPFQFKYQGETIGFIEICKNLGSGIFVVSLVAVSANIAIAKTYSKSDMQYSSDD